MQVDDNITEVDVETTDGSVQDNTAHSVEGGNRSVEAAMTGERQGLTKLWAEHRHLVTRVESLEDRRIVERNASIKKAVDMSTGLMIKKGQMGESAIVQPDHLHSQDVLQTLLDRIETLEIAVKDLQAAVSRRKEKEFVITSIDIYKEPEIKFVDLDRQVYDAKSTFPTTFVVTTVDGKRTLAYIAAQLQEYFYGMEANTSRRNDVLDALQTSSIGPLSLSRGLVKKVKKLTGNKNSNALFNSSVMNAVFSAPIDYMLRFPDQKIYSYTKNRRGEFVGALQEKFEKLKGNWQAAIGNKRLELVESFSPNRESIEYKVVENPDPEAAAREKFIFTE